MEEIETNVSPENVAERKPEPTRWYEGHISLEDAKTFIKTNIATAARSFIAIGFYLKCVKDRELFKEEEYESVWDFAKAEYGISKSTASRYMSMNDRFSENGNSPSIREEYKAFGKSQLQEMLSLEEDQLDQVNPTDRVGDIRNLRKYKEMPYIELPGQMEIEIDFPDTLPPDQLLQHTFSQSQPVAFEISVEDMLPVEEKESIAISQQVKGVEQETETEWTSEFSIVPTGCPYRATYSCTIPIEKRAVPGDGYNCGTSCCWSCKFHGSCNLECNASGGRDGMIPEYDAAWFVKKWAEKVPEELERALKVCRESSTNTERAKAVQKEISPYGAHSRSCWEYDFSFHGFSGGMDFRIGKVEMHLKYGRFVQELSGLYPDFEEPKNVPKQSESVQEATEIVISEEYVEISSEIELSPRSVLEEEKAELQSWVKVFQEEGVNPPPMVERKKIIVDALSAMAEDLEVPEPVEFVKQEQPELPLMKNNDQRAAFIDAYETWPVWVETQETRERYYRYDLSEKVAIVVKVYWKHSWASYKESKDYEYGAEQYYLLGVKSEWHSGKSVHVEDNTRTFYECNTNRSALVEYLKELQKKKES